MATPITLHFSDNVSLYNAIGLANRINELHPNCYTISVQYANTSSADAEATLNAYSGTDTQKLNAYINGTLNSGTFPALTGKYIKPEDDSLTLAGTADYDVALSLTPRIKTDLTLDFAGYSYLGDRLEIIHPDLKINERPYVDFQDPDDPDLLILFRSPLSGIRIDDGTANKIVPIQGPGRLIANSATLSP